MTLPRRTAARWLCSLAFLLVVAGCTPGSGASCPCFPCDAAVTLTVVDAEDQGPIDDFVMEAVVNGEPIGTPERCSPTQRVGNACAFGAESGLYHLIVTAPGYAVHEELVRLTEPPSGCCNACLTDRSVTLALDPL